MAHILPLPKQINLKEVLREMHVFPKVKLEDGLIVAVVVMYVIGLVAALNYVLITR